MRSVLLILLAFLISCGSGKGPSHGDPASTKHMFGNSMFAFRNHAVQRVLKSKYEADFIDHSVIGAETEQIKMQWLNAIGSGETVKVAVIDGGANDVLISLSCYVLDDDDDIGRECKNVIEDVADTFNSMIRNMIRGGVTKTIILVGSYHPIGLSKGFNKAVDYSYPLFKTICKTPECTLIDPRDAFNKDIFYWFDGSHPSEEGARLLAKLIMDKDMSP